MSAISGMTPAQVIRKWDRNGNGVINLAAGHKDRQGMSAAVLKALRAADSNHDGKVGVAELRRALSDVSSSGGGGGTPAPPPLHEPDKSGDPTPTVPVVPVHPNPNGGGTPPTPIIP